MLPVFPIARALRSAPARLGAGVTVLVALMGAVGPLLARDPYASDFARGLDALGMPKGPDRVFWLGVDRLFRDECARLVYATRHSLTIGVASSLLAAALGTFVGIVAGYYEGRPGLRLPWPAVLGALACVAFVSTGHLKPALAALLLTGAVVVFRAIKRSERGRVEAHVNADDVLMRLVDIGLSLPFLLLVMAIGAAVGETTTSTVILVLGATGWLSIARIVRAHTMVVRDAEYVMAARALGESTVRVMLRHIVPNVSGPVLVLATLSVGQMILAESVLAYLGLGLAPPAPTWGRMIFEGQDYFQTAPWLVIAPGAAVLTTVVGFQLLGEGMRDALGIRRV